MSELQAKILVVDDDEKNVKLMQAMLMPRGYKVTTAFDGSKALQRVEEKVPDIILLDVMMPIMNGYEVCAKLKNNPRTQLIPIVMMTALGEVENRIKGIESGADDYLTKPIYRDELLARIETSLRLKRTIESKMDLLQGMKAYLAKFLPLSIQHALEEHPEGLELERREQDVSVLFVEISGYDRFNEVPPHRVGDIVEQYFSRFLDCIHVNEGEIVETVGDGMMAIFQDIEPRHHARKAVQAAFEMMYKTVELNEQPRGTFEDISVHIGINSGSAYVGPVRLEGATGTRWTYTAYGTVANVASRIAALAEEGTILLSAETARRISGYFATQALGRQQLRYIAEKVMIYSVLGQQNTTIAE